MRQLLAGLLVATATATLVAQSAQPNRVNPTGPPEFPAGETEGLVMAGPRGDARHAWKRKVFWKPGSGGAPMVDRRVPAHTAAERQAMTRTLDALTGLLKATPTGSQGEGFWVMDSRTLDYVDVLLTPPTAPLARWPLQFQSRLFPFYHEDILKNDGTWRLSVAGETESVAFTFNRLPGAVQQATVAKEKEVGDRLPVELYLRPRVTATWAGHPVYENDLLVVARPGRDPWAPVGVGRALAALMAAFEKDVQTAEQRLAGYRKKDAEVQSPAWEQQMRDTFEKNNGALRTTRPSNYAARQASMEHEIRYTREKAAAEANPRRDANGAWYWNPLDALEAAKKRQAALTPADAARPACFVEASGTARPDGSKPNDGRYAVRGDIVAVGEVPGCRELVETSPTYFDTSLPRTTPQILTVDFGRCATVKGGAIEMPPVRRFDAPAQGCFQHRRMWAEADWAAIVALVMP